LQYDGPSWKKTQKKTVLQLAYPKDQQKHKDYVTTKPKTKKGKQKQQRKTEVPLILSH